MTKPDNNPAHERIFGEIRSLAARTTNTLAYDKLENIFRMFPLCEEAFLINQVFPYMRETLRPLLLSVVVNDPSEPPELKHLLYDYFQYYVFQPPSAECLASPYWRSCKELMVCLGVADDVPFFPTDQVFMDRLESLSFRNGCQSSTDLCFYLASLCPNLRKIHLADSMFLGEYAFLLPNLEVLHINFPADVRAFSERIIAPKLKELHLKWGTLFSESPLTLPPTITFGSQCSLMVRVQDKADSVQVFHIQTTFSRL